MAKHFYHIPLQSTLHFIRDHRSDLQTLANDTKMLYYRSQIGKSIYILEIEKFIAFFKIDKETDYALKTLEYFTSKPFIDEMARLLHFEQFTLADRKVENKSFFFGFCAVYADREPDLFSHFIEKTLLHYHSAFHKSANIVIDYRDMCHYLAKSKHIALKESFGEVEGDSFFKIAVNGTPAVSLRGKRIKTLRKKAYRQLLNLLASWGDSAETDPEAQKAYEALEALKYATE